MKLIETDICVIGAGSGGLSVAAGAVQMGARVVLVEKGKMGGDCLNTGCVPSKALLAAAKKAHAHVDAQDFGVTYTKPKINFKAVHNHIHDVIAGIAPHDSVERFRDLGVDVIKAKGHFISPTCLQAGQIQITAKRFVIATGSRAATPPIPGLDTVPYMTNESVFDLKASPDHIMIIGGGPIGCEMAQSFARLGSKITLLEIFNILPKDDPDCVAVIRRQLEKEGIRIHEQIQIQHVEKSGKSIKITFQYAGKTKTITGSHLLIAAGRKPNIEELGLDNAGIAHSPRGVTVDARLRTNHKHIFAIGDVSGGYQFTHMAGYHAGIVIRNILFRLPAKANTKAVPWVTYTDPELAHVGMMHDQAAKEYPGTKVFTFPYAEVDRARAERHTEGLIKVSTTQSGRILGVSIVGAHAGELLMPWTMAIGQSQKIGTMASVIAAYPTYSEISKRVAGSFFTPTLFSDRTKMIVRWLLKLP